MNIKPFHCETCKQEKSTVLVDGYAFGDRLFDGVMFVVENVNGKLSVRVLLKKPKNISMEKTKRNR